MACAHLIHGYLGAGKTTLARRLEAGHRAVRFTHDEWMAALFGPDPPEATFREAAPRVSGLIEEVWGRCLLAGVDVVLDTGFWRRAERDAARSRAAALGGRAVLYRLDAPADLAWARIERRNAEGGAGLFIARATFEGLRARFEALAADEERIEVSSG